MADLVSIKRGSIGDRAEMPILNDGELGFRKDEKALYIGSNNKNVRLCGENDANNINTLLAEINSLNAKISSLNAEINDITARLEELEKPSE